MAPSDTYISTELRGCLYVCRPVRPSRLQQAHLCYCCCYWCCCKKGQQANSPNDTMRGNAWEKLQASYTSTTSKPCWPGLDCWAWLIVVVVVVALLQKQASTRAGDFRQPKRRHSVRSVVDSKLFCCVYYFIAVDLVTVVGKRVCQPFGAA